jgi:uncharacterized protein (DUF58 family)
MQRTTSSPISPRALLLPSAPVQWRDLKLRPTRFGVWYGIFGILMLIGCINYQLSLGYFFTFWLLVLWPLSALYAVRALLGLSFSARAPAQQIFVGGTAHFVITCENPTPQVRPTFMVKVGGVQDLLEAPVRSSSPADLYLPAPARGWLDLPKVLLETADPMGLFRVRLERTFPLQVLVFPAPELEGPALPAPSPRADGTAKSGGQSLFLPSGEGEDFAGLRPYQPGDPLRRVAWKQSVRGEGLLSKQFETPVVNALWLSWNALPSSLDLEPRLSRLTAWVLSAERGSAPYALELPGQTFEPARGEGHSRRVLTALALYQSVSTPEIPASEKGNG